MVLDAAKASLVGLPGLKLTAVIFSFRIRAEQELRPLGLTFQLLQIRHGYVSVDVVEHLILCEASLLCDAGLQLEKGHPAVSEPDEERLVDKGDACFDLLKIVVQAELIVQSDGQSAGKLRANIRILQHLIEVRKRDLRQIRIAHQLILKLLARHIVVELGYHYRRCLTEAPRASRFARDPPVLRISSVRAAALLLLLLRSAAVVARWENVRVDVVELVFDHEALSFICQLVLVHQL